MSGCYLELGRTTAIRKCPQECTSAALYKEFLCYPNLFYFFLLNRLYPIVPYNTRILEEDIVLSGYRIPAGVR